MWNVISGNSKIIISIIGPLFIFFVKSRINENQKIKEKKKSILDELILNKSAIECYKPDNELYKKFSLALNSIPLNYPKDSDVLNKYHIFQNELKDYRRRQCRSEEGSFELILYESFYHLIYSICDDLKIERI